MKKLLLSALLLASPAFAQNKPMLQLNPPTAPTFPIVLDAAQKARLNQALQGQHANYDPEVQLIKRPFSSPGYHTTLKGGMVHPTRDSAMYAAALLDTDDPAMHQRAAAIFRKIVSLQDTNPANNTYGIWSWFYEEPLTKMAPPDWNWADFIGVQLLQAVLSHRDKLPADLVGQMDAAIGHASRAIIKRNVGPGYTNIAIMGTYVTLVAGEEYGSAELLDYGLQRLKNFHAHTQKHGAFTEYNSPTYTIVALEEIGRLRAHVQTPEAKKLIEDIYRVAWEEIAGHFHAPSRQWAGPHSRCYSTLLTKGVLAQIQRSTQGRVKFGETAAPSTLEHRLPLPCPRDLEEYFTKLDAPRELVKTFVRDDNPVVGTTYLSPQFTLGTINRGDLWNQRRSLIAYWGTAQAPSYMHLRFLHDGYDYSAAQIFSAQRAGRAVAAINFATDGGDTHISLDRIKNATIKAKDLRLRFEFGGDAGKTAPVAPANLSDAAPLNIAGLPLQIAVPFAKLGEFAGRYESGAKDGKAWLDVVFYSGEERSFNFAEMPEAALAVAVQIGGEAVAKPLLQNTDGKVKIELENLSVQIPTRPAKVGELQKAFVAKR